MATLTLNVIRNGTASVGAQVIALYGAAGGSAACFDGTTDANGQIVKTVNSTFQAVAVVFVKHSGGQTVGGAGHLFEANGTVTIG